MGQFIQGQETVSVGKGQITTDIVIGNLQAGAIRAAFGGNLIANGNTRVHGYMGSGGVQGKLVVDATATDINTAQSADTIPLTIYIYEDGRSVWAKTYDPKSKDGEMIFFSIKLDIQKQ